MGREETKNDDWGAKNTPGSSGTASGLHSYSMFSSLCSNMYGISYLDWVIFLWLCL